MQRRTNNTARRISPRYLSLRRKPGEANAAHEKGIISDQMKKSDLLAGVRCFLLDMDGTIYLGAQLLPGASESLHLLAQQGRQYLFLTNNSSKDARQYAEKFARLGLPIPPASIMTSGEATAMYLQRQVPGARVYVVGTESLEREFHDRGFVLTEENPEVVILGF